MIQIFKGSCEQMTVRVNQEISIGDCDPISHQEGTDYTDHNKKKKPKQDSFDRI